MIVCTALGAVFGFLVARLFAAKAGGKNAEDAGPFATVETVRTFDTLDKPVVAVERTRADPPIDLQIESTDAEIDALPPEVPVLVRRQKVKPPPRIRNFDRL